MKTLISLMVVVVGLSAQAKSNASCGETTTGNIHTAGRDNKTVSVQVAKVEPAKPLTRGTNKR